MEKSNKIQIVFIHGGDSFNTKDELYTFLRSLDYNPYATEQKKWRESIQEILSETHECFMPRMPNSWDADYTAWSIWFEKVVPYLHEGVILVGHSLGGGFLLRYLTENSLPVTIHQLHLVSPVVDELDCDGVGEFKIDLTTWSSFQSNIKSVHLWHSKNDTFVPFHHSERFVAKYPKATLHTFTDRGHFLISDFPELLQVIKG